MARTQMTREGITETAIIPKAYLANQSPGCTTIK